MMIPKPIKTVVKKFQKIQRKNVIKRTKRHITKIGIVKDLRNLGLKEGDTIFLHSSLKSIGYVEGGAKTVIEAFIEVLSSSGTLIVPTFSMNGTIYATCQAKDYLFDVRSAETGLGLIPSTFLKRPNIYRSIHPTHSVSAIGKHAKYITESHHLASSTFGPDSPWDRLMKLDGKLFALGLKMGKNTFSHVLEDRTLDNFPLPVRMKQTYYLGCKDWSGNLLEVPVTPLDPEYGRIRMDKKNRQDLRDYFWQEFTQAEILTVGKVGQAISWIASANEYYGHLLNLMKEGITIYSSPDDLKKRPLPAEKFQTDTTSLFSSSSKIPTLAGKGKGGGERGNF